MNKADLLQEIVATYLKHGWQLRRVLLMPSTGASLGTEVSGVAWEESEVDALWFSRPSHNNREAWELRLLSESQYALFETFEQDETEEERSDVKLEMEARLREHFNR